MFYKTLMLFSVASASLLAQNPASNMVLEKAVFEEQIAIDTLGVKTRKMIPVKRVQREATLVYVNRLTNKSKAVKSNIVVVNPIPFNTEYLRGSATCEGSCKILFSIDGGKSFDYGEKLYVVYGAKKRVAMGKEYTHVKFTFKTIKPLSRTRMAFKSKVK
jgi:uncharacterized repeat protein (TIGR01451 family)